jgi:hypothetical protein
MLLLYKYINENDENIRDEFDEGLDCGLFVIIFIFLLLLAILLLLLFAILLLLLTL